MKKLSFFLSLLFFIPSLQSQSPITLKGKVIESETNEPLADVSVLVPKTKKRTITNIDGNFELTIIDTTKAIQIYYGHSNQIFDLSNRKLTDFQVFEMTGKEYIFGTDIIVAANSIVTKESIGSISVLEKKDLTIDNETAITPALNRVPGVFMHTGALNTNRITIRGIGNRSPFATSKIKAYLDEIPLTTGIGETTIEDIDLSILDGVNVIKGPTASTYGAGLGGMLGLYTDTKTKIANSVSTQMTVGSYGLIRNVADFKIGKTNKYKLHFNFNNTHSDGYRDNNEYDRRGYTLLGAVTPNLNNKLTFFANYTKLKAFIPSSLSQADFDTEPTKAAFTWGRIMGFEDYEKILIGLSYRTYLTENFKNTSSLFTTNYDAYESRPFNILQEERLTMGGRTVFEWQPNSGWIPNTRLGGEYFYEEYDWQTYQTNDGDIGPLLSNNLEKRIFFNAFMQTQWVVENHTQIKAGLNINSTNYDLEDRFNVDSLSISGDYSFEDIISPYFAVNHSLHSSMGWDGVEVSVYGLLSHGFSPPSLEETLTPDGQINRDIQPERGWNLELGSRGNWQNLQWTLTTFSMRIEDLLVARRTAFDQFVGVNAGKTIHNGIEAELRYQREICKLDWNFFANYSYSDFTFDEFIDGEDDFSGNELTGTAPHIFSGGVNVSSKIGIYSHLNYQFVDEMPMRDDNSIYSESWQVVNVKLGWKKQWGTHWEIDGYIGINNLLDEKYASMILINAASFGGNAPRYYYPGLPRNYFGGLRLKYLF